MFANPSSRRLATLGVVASLVALSAPAAADTENRTLALEVGQQVSLPATTVIKYSEGAPGIVDVRLPADGKEFILVGQRAGATTLLLIHEDGSRVQYDLTVTAAGNEVEASENIRLDFYFVELVETSSRQVGIAWPSSIGGATVSAEFDLQAGALASATASLAGHALPRLDFLQVGGWAKVARQASVITANGKDASFESGGEVNIPVQGSLAAELRKIPFGTTVKIKPRYDRKSGRLELSIDAEVASLSEGEVPGRSLSKINTVVNVEMNQAVVLAGINAQAEAHSSAGLPLLSQIPVFGHLFGSKASRQERTQSVIFIVPSVVDVVALEGRRRLEASLAIYADYAGGLDEVQLHPGAKK